MMHNSSWKSLWLKLTFKYFKNAYSTVRMIWFLQASLPQPAKGKQSRQRVFAYRRKVENFGFSVQQEGKKTHFCMHEWQRQTGYNQTYMLSCEQKFPRHFAPRSFGFLDTSNAVWKWCLNGEKCDKEGVKRTRLELQHWDCKTGRKLSKEGCEVCQAHEKNHAGMYWTMCPGIFEIKTFSWHMFQSKHNRLGWIQT